MYVIELYCSADTNIKRNITDLLYRSFRTFHSETKLVLNIAVYCYDDMQASCKREIKNFVACRVSTNSLLCRIQKAVLLGSLHIV